MAETFRDHVSRSSATGTASPTRGGPTGWSALSRPTRCPWSLRKALAAEGRRTRVSRVFRDQDETSALLDLFEQPHVLDGDHSLIGKSFKQFDLFICEGKHLRTANIDRTNGHTFTKQRGDEHRACSGEPLAFIRFRVFSFDFCCQVVNMGRFPVDYRSTHRRGAANLMGSGTGIAPYWATCLRTSPSTRVMTASFASQSRAAFSATTSSTG